MDGCDSHPFGEPFDDSPSQPHPETKPQKDRTEGNEGNEGAAKEVCFFLRSHL